MSEPTHTTVAVIERAGVGDNMSPVVRAGMAILAQSPSPETLRELLAVQQDWERDEARKRYALALVDLKRDLPTVIARDQKVEFGNTRYTHASLAAVMEAVTGPLTMHGFSLAWDPSSTPQVVTVKCRLTHAAGHFEECTLSGPIDTKGSKSPVQGVMSTVTMLERYTALALLGISTRDMPEPTGESLPPDPSQINTERNMKAVGALKKYGRTREQAETFLGRQVAEWTAGDIDKLKAWLGALPAPVNNPPAQMNKTDSVNTPGRSAGLTEIILAIESAQSQAELDAIKPHAAKLGKQDKPKAIEAWRAKAASVKAQTELAGRTDGRSPASGIA